MFAVHFDDMRRRLLERPVEAYPWELKRLTTCMKGTPLWDEWVEKFEADTNTDIHLTIEADTTTYTFYSVVPREVEAIDKAD